VLSRLALRIVALTLFSTELADDLMDSLQHASETAFRGFFLRVFTPQPLQRLPLPTNRRYRDALQQLHGIADSVIADCRNDGQQQGGLLSTLTDPAQDGGAVPGDAEVHGQVITMLEAGTETVATALCWALYLLSQHPADERRVHEEVNGTLGARPAQWADLPNLPFTRQVITEALRLYPPAWFLARFTTKAVTLAGTELPPGATIAIAPSAVLRQAGIYSNPSAFDPDRWLPDRSAALPRHAFPAFGGGPRKCIGENDGMAEATLILATIAARWRTECMPGADIRAPPLATFYRPRHLRLRLHARHSSATSGK